MAITSLGFLVFLAASLAGFYLLPRPHRWKLLLAVSLLFAASFDLRSLPWLAAASGSIWLAGLAIAARMENGRPGPGAKAILAAALVFNIGILALLKYLLPTALGLWGKSAAGIFVPLGLSYYTLQAVSYVLDVYWGRCSAQRSWPRLLLFVCYFPQLLQGPISRWGDLSGALYEQDHRFQIRNLKHGVQLMLWGYFKMLVVSESAAVFVSAAFSGSDTAYGLTAFLGLALFGLRLYGNFSGGIDLIRGVSECFGIDLPDNFRQPFFSASLGEFWRRWHITLGSWMKDYVFYPFSLSRAVSKFKKKAKKRLSRKWANRIPIAFANLLVFLLVGIWHGLGGNYALWGLYNGLILALGELMTDVFRRGKTVLRIPEQSAPWKLFCIARTFLIVTLGWCTDCASTASGSLAILGNMTRVGRTNLALLAAEPLDWIALGVGLTALVTVSVLHEKNISIRQALDRRPTWVQMLFWIVFIQLIALLRGTSVAAGEFMYADF